MIASANAAANAASLAGSTSEAFAFRGAFAVRTSIAGAAGGHTGCIATVDFGARVSRAAIPAATLSADRIGPVNFCCPAAQDLPARAAASATRSAIRRNVATMSVVSPRPSASHACW